MNRLKRFGDLFRFREDIRFKSSKIARPRVVNDFVDTRFSQISLQNPFACLYGAQVQFFLYPSVENRDTVPLKTDLE